MQVITKIKFRGESYKATIKIVITSFLAQTIKG